MRAWALYDHALDAHDAALGRLLAALRAAGIEDDTAVIVTSDVGADRGRRPCPSSTATRSTSPLLATPLVIRWPHADALVGRRVDAPSSTVDLARTVVAMLGLPPPAGFQGVDLACKPPGRAVPAERPLAATRGDRFAVRWGSFMLLGARDRETRLCDLSLDPACVADLRSTSPIALESLRRWASREPAAHLRPRPFRASLPCSTGIRRQPSCAGGARATNATPKTNVDWHSGHWDCARPREAIASVGFRGELRGVRGGERGIRTLGTLAGTHDFQSCTFDHSVISPVAATWTAGARHARVAALLACPLDNALRSLQLARRRAVRVAEGA